jgi:hypothetical protein
MQKGKRTTEIYFPPVFKLIPLFRKVDSIRKGIESNPVVVFLDNLLFDLLTAWEDHRREVKEMKAYRKWYAIKVYEEMRRGEI